jgi:hypothetical protein
MGEEKDKADIPRISRSTYSYENYLYPRMPASLSLKMGNNREENIKSPALSENPH